MRLVASVGRVTGSTTHTLATERGVARMEPATRLEIVESADGVMLLRYSAEGAFVGDTWHSSIDDAKQQATFEFEVGPNDWSADPVQMGRL
jgi:hypothetical protein